MTEQVGVGLVENLVSTIRLAILSVVLAVWTIVGFVFWVPLLTRTTAMFSIGVLYTMLAANPREYTERLRGHLDFAMAFYVEGYQRIFLTLHPRGTDSSPDKIKQKILNLSKTEFKWERFLAELAWTIFFWLAVLLGPTIMKSLFRLIRSVV